ncbi:MULTISPECIES: MFS transporter [Metallibacterium]|jgi:maltose/moltooligosaccharide transporter|uniref:MFS transporter n=1 Tax=Metallibacterium TaxID=1218803 RepID=UPI00260A50AF|nr:MULTISPECIES: MFS transporter [Metallibacterium]MBW8073910.1 MFS transporter [Metallibacterium scheffleri]
MSLRGGLRQAVSGDDGKPLLSLRQIVNMNLGFFGIQFSFGLQQSNMSPIYKYLGAHDATLPYLWLAGPVTGLIVQPLIGALSDRTLSPLGRRTPYFLIGALIATLGLLAMPYSPALWVAAGLLWILDAANNVTMEPYRAFVSDRLSRDQHAVGFLMQSAFTGLSQTLAYLMPSLLVLLGLHVGMVNAHGIPYAVVVAFLIGAVFSIGTVGWSAWTTPELPLSANEIARIRSAPRSPSATVREILDAVREMPPTMRQLALMMLFQWYAMFCYWEYIPLSLARTLFGAADPHSADFTRAVLINGQIGGFYNFLAFLAALAMLPLARRYGARALHVCSLLAGGVGLLALPQVHSHALLFVPMVGLGIAWASMMGNPYALLADSVPPQRAGVYMGLFNVFIVVPMLLQIITLPLYYNALLRGNPENVIRLAGVLLLAAALLTLRVDRGRRAATQ